MNYDLLFEKQQFYKNNIHLIPYELLEKIQLAFQIEFTHNSTAIEGNTLTLIDTKVILEDKISIGGKRLSEIFEIVNNHKATLYVEECVQNGNCLDKNITKNIHSLINENIIVGGVYRNEKVVITGANFVPPVGDKMFYDIKNFFNNLDSRTDLNPIELAAWTHAEFVRIHPFIDGNGRTARQLMNYQLQLYGFPPISISVKDSDEYYKSLDVYGSESNIRPFTEYVAKLVEQRLDTYKSYILVNDENVKVE